MIPLPRPTSLALAALSLLAGCLQAASPATIKHRGMANASAVIAVGDDAFFAASDEDNTLRLYAAGEEGPAKASFDATPWLGLKGGKSSEADFEGAARIGDVIYWIGSHGRNKDGRNRPARQRVLATRIVETNGSFQLRPLGPAYPGLLSDLVRAPQLAPFALRAAVRLSPEESGGLNIEGLAATPEGNLLIALRSPAPGGRALLVPLLNPAELAAGVPAKLGEPALLDLGGAGVRDIVWTGQEYYLIAGHPTDGGHQRLYRWPGPGQPATEIGHPSFKSFNPEAITAFGRPGSLRLLVLSDDGNRKQSKNPDDRKFRSFWIDPK